ncbi:leucine-rich repeat flightless-interacting protein 2-like isoform X2 [Dunckerocampus dactyliophorus]|uniref:leucine-rich repeat flightless-interacting protein 2-like isoform X2 n=1 Tax=Dunckerocampus dactyliophorus TaxID=161453 RepID=UPI0024064255|nr:leucine-rich repeat flightless-interacting protein 2-like isoform X2 [Dunckerocampus dactyliophorus]
MLSVTVDNSGSPKKRAFSRGISEDESLRSFIKEAESSSRRLPRSDSRAGTLKRRPDSQSEKDLLMGLPEMLELQASYDEALHELRGLEVEREALLFQVDVLQDTLEGVEELLAEAQREARDAHLELERERDAKRKLESVVRSLMQKVETLKEERNTKEPMCDHTGESEVDAKRSGHQMNGNADEDTSLCEAAPASKADEGSVMTKMRWVANSTPSLALDSPACGDGVHRRPYESCTEGGRDPSPDKSDSDTASTYEDASAETPEQQHVFPGDTQELPHDSTTHQVTNECNTDSTDSHEAQSSDNCVVS